MTRLLKAAVFAVLVAVLLAGCTKVLDGKAVSVSSDPTQIDGKPITDEPSGLRPNAPGPVRHVQNGDGGKIDTLALFAIADIEEFWNGAYGLPLKGEFEPVKSLFSYNSKYKRGTFCGADTFGQVNAGWCSGTSNLIQNCDSVPQGTCTPSFNTIGWDRGVLLPLLENGFGDMAVAMVFAHEYGHAIQTVMADLVHESDPFVRKMVKEQQADCFAGTYLKWVADRKSPRFTLNLGDGLNEVLLGMLGIRDSLRGEQDPRLAGNFHGTAFERISAFQFGFRDGVKACTDIDGKEIERRTGNLPPEFLAKGQTGEAIPSKETVTAVIDTLVSVFSPTSPPKVDYAPPSCPDATPTPPATYCPSDNTISVDLNRLIVMGTSLTRGSSLVNKSTTPLFGDYTAYSVLASRFMLALQNARGGVALDTPDAGLRTACLTGVATARLTKTANGLTGGDLDEAVAGLLTNGLAASNVKGEFALSGFARVNAFRTGVLGDEKNCYEQWK